ncbi:Trp biosynthesis-associated membrane protein [Actinoplanes xinjiangensis]|uniref:Putative membrane protein (TIGR02234 family) n=1 Tax=Actinoplanes xinjiangensis TaxID=512350 RepID=A0A316G5V1_9ACTN|nr:Trp biosynthesis-associated membrane protein [Actinoplanes xinjiangensis]PWK49807.1 putative membrane protein (TIGR02234 family) [Actinoplanes xinjiangensis]GIF37814.1 membrane protein [Actinoplanes xinjiangensis]
MRTYPAAVASGLAGAGLALFGATRVWAVAVEQRPGLSDLRTEQTGAEAQPWLIGLAVVALAGTGALLATRGVVRRLLGAVLALAGAGIAVGAVLARAGVDPGAAGPAGTAWPVACAGGGAAVLVAGVLAARHGHRWSAMSARYERRPAAPVRVEADGPTAGRDLWDALDRGEDPTAR